MRISNERKANFEQILNMIILKAKKKTILKNENFIKMGILKKWEF